jgi:hypothetical protein
MFLRTGYSTMITNGGAPLAGFNTFLKMFMWHNLQF